jgi:hypothetical protein
LRIGHRNLLSEGEALVWPVPHEHRLPEPSPLWMSEVHQCNITCIDDAHPPNFISILGGMGAF